MDAIKRHLRLLVLSLLCLGTTSSLTDANHDYFTVNVYLDSATEDVNAFEAELKYPATWDIERIKFKDSDLIYWVQTPQENLNGVMDFSGIFPGGVQNLKNYSSPLKLFSVEFAGDLEDATQVNLIGENIYLNHPMALEATDASISFEVDSSVSRSFETDVSPLSHLDYEFTVDPISGQDALVVNTYRGALASYKFELREGDFGQGLWSRVNGVALLKDFNSTVKLFITSPDGEELRLVLRSSMTRYILIGSGVVLGTAFIFYLFFLAFRALQTDDLAIHAARERARLK